MSDIIEILDEVERLRHAGDVHEYDVALRTHFPALSAALRRYEEALETSQVSGQSIVDRCSEALKGEGGQ